MSREIPLTKGKVTIVDDADYEHLCQHSWSYSKTGYAAARIDCKLILMHRYLVDTPPGMYVDHINRDRLDNRRANLRIVTPLQSMMNHSKQRNATSVFRGVSLIGNRWEAKIVVERQEIRLGRFLTQREAANAYNEAALEYFGEYAAPNVLSILEPEDDQPRSSRPKTSPYVGVYLQREMWIASIMVTRKKYRIGKFNTDIEAARAYDLFVVEHGINRPLNFP